MSKGTKWALFLIGYSIIPIFAVIGYPIIHTTYLAFTTGEGVFTLQNYFRLGRDPLFLYSTVFTLAFGFLSIGGGTVVGLSLSIAVNRIKAPYLIPLFVVPYIIPPVVAGVTWRIIFHPTMGVVNYLLSIFGAQPVLWLSSPFPAAFVVVVIQIWRITPFFFLLLYAALQLVPQEIYEAARIDGASSWRVFKDMTLPSVLPTILIGSMFGWIQSTRAFAHILTATGGGPGTGTWNLSFFIYITAFRTLEYNYASSSTYMLLFIMLSVGLILMKQTWRAEEFKR